MVILVGRPDYTAIYLTHLDIHMSFVYTLQEVIIGLEISSVMIIHYKAVVALIEFGTQLNIRIQSVYTGTYINIYTQACLYGSHSNSTGISCSICTDYFLLWHAKL